MKTIDQKREEAEKRQQHYEAYGAAERIRIVQARRGESKKELTRLIRLSVDHNKGPVTGTQMIRPKK